MSIENKHRISIQREEDQRTHRSRRMLKLLTVLLTLVLVAAACGDDDASDTSDTGDDAGDTSDTGDDAGDTSDTGDDAGDTGDDADDAGDTGDDGDDAGETGDDMGEEDSMEGVLAGVCPDPLIIQTDWHAQAEHGPTYELLGQDYEAANGTVRGTLVASGEVDTGIDVEIREGGPAIGWQQVSSQMYQDPDIFFGYSSTDGSVENSVDQPIVSLVSLLEVNPQMIMWNPEQFPGVDRVADLPDDASILAYLWGAPIYWLIDAGIVDANQIDGSYDGGVTRFVAEDGAFGQMGYASAEPYIYESETPEYAKPVKYELLHDMGFEIYAQNLGVRPERLEEDRACLELLVPITQQAAVDYVNDGAETNGVIIDVNAIYDDGWVYSSGLADFANREFGRLGLIGNGPDDTVGNFDMDRVQTLVEQMIPVFANPEINIEIVEGITAEDIVSNEFIDESIGF